MKTFRQFKPHLGSPFVYFVEDMYVEIEEKQPGRWANAISDFKAACPECGVYVEKPEDYDGHAKTSRVVVLTSKPISGEN